MRTITPKQLDSLESLLKKSSASKPMTANALAKRLKCSRDAALRRIDALRRARKGFLKIRETAVREGLRGPESVGFYVGGEL